MHPTDHDVAAALAVAVEFADAATSGRVRLCSWARAAGLDPGQGTALAATLQHRGLLYWDRERDELTPTTSGRGWLAQRLGTACTPGYRGEGQTT
jgi:hypothetical protein